MIAAIVLAAGLSTRMGGRSKALLAIDNRDCFVTRIVRTFNAAGITDVVVVVGHEAPRVAAAIEASRLAPRVVLNAHYEQGQFSSVLAGVAAVDRPDVEAAFLALVDAPLFSESTVCALADRFRHTRAPVVRAVRGGEHGHPVLLSRDLFASIRAADPAFGAKPLVRRHASLAGDVEVTDPGAFVDVDTPGDYDALVRA